MGLRFLSEPLMNALIDFAYEAFDNTRRHAVRSLEGDPLEGARFLLVRAIWVDGERASELADGVASSSMGQYMTALSRAVEGRLRLVEMSVADSGPGIAATLAGSGEIHRGPREPEVELLKAAFESGRTRRRTSAGAGRGLFKALRATEQLGGLVAVRSGRTRLCKAFASGVDPEWVAEELPSLPGTSLSLLFPWLDRSQLSLLSPA
jgi:hypothetical protein